MSVREITRYQTSDSQLFTSEQQAERHERDLIGAKLQALLIELYPDAHRPSTYAGISKLIDEPGGKAATLLCDLHRMINE